MEQAKFHSATKAERKGEGAGELVLHKGERGLKVTIINAALSDESIYNQHYYTARSLRPIRER